MGCLTINILYFLRNPQLVKQVTTLTTTTNKIRETKGSYTILTWKKRRHQPTLSILDQTGYLTLENNHTLDYLEREMVWMTVTRFTTEERIEPRTWTLFYLILVSIRCLLYIVLVLYSEAKNIVSGFSDLIGSPTPPHEEPKGKLLLERLVDVPFFLSIDCRRSTKWKP